MFKIFEKKSSNIKMLIMKSFAVISFELLAQNFSYFSSDTENTFYMQNQNKRFLNKTNKK